MSARELTIVSRSFHASTLLDVISLSFVCGSAYEAQVLFEDLSERLRRGEEVVLRLAHAEAPERLQ